MSRRKALSAFLFLVVMLMMCVCRPMETEASVGRVTSYQKITWGISTGRYGVNDIHAFCAEYPKECPTVGTEIISIQESTNDLLRKALYYGYGGPKNVLGTDDKAYILTSVAISDANIGERATAVSAKYDEFYWDMVDNPSKYPSPPAWFRVYLAEPKSNEMQKLAFFEVEKPGYVTAVKKSANPEITEGNACYDLTGAEYGIYTKANADSNSKVGTLVVGANGKSNKVELWAGTYYAKEDKAPKGYAKDEKIHKFTVKADETVTLQFLDDPQVHPMDLLLQKVDGATGQAWAEGNRSLEGAEFEVKYYSGIWETNIDPASLGQHPTKSWIFKTDVKGQLYMEESYLVSGDELCAALPLGTITIREIKASYGYLINPTMFVRQITTQGNTKHTNTYQYPIVEEERIPPYELVIHKTDTFGNLIKDAEFTLYKDEMCQEEIAKGITDENGILRFQDLEIGSQYYLKETKTPAGYKKPEEEMIYEVHLEQSPEQNEYHLEIENEVELYIPKTGSASTILVPMLGMGLCGISLYLSKEKGENKHEKNQ